MVSWSGCSRRPKHFAAGEVVQAAGFFSFIARVSLGAGPSLQPWVSCEPSCVLAFSFFEIPNPGAFCRVRDPYPLPKCVPSEHRYHSDPSPRLKAGDSGFQKSDQLSYTHFPPTIVRSIGISTMLPGGSFHGSRPRTTRSAHLPIDIEPFSASS